MILSLSLALLLLQTTALQGIDTASVSTASVSASSVPIAESSNAAAAPADEPLPSPYGGWSLNLGGHLTFTEGNSSTRVYGLSVNADHESERWFLGAEGSGRYGKSRRVSVRPNPDAETEAGRAGRPAGDFEEHVNDWFVSGKYGRYLSHRRTDYLYGLGAAESDEFRGFWLRYQTQAGYGRRIANEHISFKGEFGFDFTEDLQVVGDVRSRMAFAVNALLDYRVNESLSLRQNLSHMRTVLSNDKDPHSAGDHRTRSTTHVTTRLTDDFDLRLSALWEHSSHPAPGAHHNDVRFNTSLIYSFL